MRYIKIPDNTVLSRGDVYTDEYGLNAVTVLKTFRDLDEVFYVAFKNHRGFVEAVTDVRFRDTFYMKANHGLKNGDFFRFDVPEAEGAYFLMLDEEAEYVARVGRDIGQQLYSNASHDFLSKYVDLLAGGDWGAITYVMPIGAINRYENRRYRIEKS